MNILFTIIFFKVYDEHGNIIYCMPANMKQILRENQLPSTGFVVTRNQNTVIATDGQLNDSNEPIYENIPLPWDSEMRARTQSIHSAPEAVNHVMKARQEVDNVSILIDFIFYCFVVSPTKYLQSTCTFLNKCNKKNDGIHLLQKNTHLYFKLQSKQLENVGTRISTENLYANVGTKFPSSEIINNNPSSTSANENGRYSSASTHNSNANVDTSTSSETMSRTNTFIVNKSSHNANSTIISANSAPESANTTMETLTDASSTSNASSNKVKKKRWGILMGRSKSSEKVKSATLGREKEKNKEKNQSNSRHRWSTGLPRLHPLPPSISKETMVCT